MTRTCRYASVDPEVVPDGIAGARAYCSAAGGRRAQQTPAFPLRSTPHTLNGDHDALPCGAPAGGFAGHGGLFQTTGNARSKRPTLGRCAPCLLCRNIVRLPTSTHDSAARQTNAVATASTGQLFHYLPLGRSADAAPPTRIRTCAVSAVTPLPTGAYGSQHAEPASHHRCLPDLRRPSGNPAIHRSKNTPSAEYSTSPNQATPRTAATAIVTPQAVQSDRCWPGDPPGRPQERRRAPPRWLRRQGRPKMIGTCGTAGRRDLDVAIGTKHGATPNRPGAERDMRGNDGRPDEHCNGCYEDPCQGQAGGDRHHLQTARSH